MIKKIYNYINISYLIFKNSGIIKDLLNKVFLII